MTGHNYPDHFYADALAPKQTPTGAYRAAPEMPESERKLRTARHYLHHALLLVDEALGQGGDRKPDPGSLDALRIERNAQSERIPKWDPKWVEACPQRAHPLNAETLRDHDERLAGGESHL